MPINHVGTLSKQWQLYWNLMMLKFGNHGNFFIKDELEMQVLV